MTKVFDSHGYTPISYASFYDKTKAAIAMINFVKEKERDVRNLLTEQSSMTSNESKALVLDQSSG